MSLLFIVLITLVAMAQATGPTCGIDVDNTCYYINDHCPSGTEDCSDKYSCQEETNKCCCKSACDQGWTERGAFCYYVIRTTDRMTERKAREECQKLDADLPVLKSEEENRDLANLMGQIGEPWLGMEATGNNDFKWIDGTSVSATFSAWNTGEPNNPGVENCAYMYVDQKKKGKWNNNPCMDAVHSVVCQKKK